MELKNISFSYEDGETVFEDLSLTLGDEGITALTGPSGCGKSTLLKIMAGLLKVEKGEVEPVKCAFLFQEDRLLKGLSAEKQIRAVLPEGTSEKTVLSWLDAVGLKDEKDTPADTFSGGMKRRLALARCLAFAEVKGKELLLLDEPFAGVDGERSLQILERIREMHIPAVMAVHGTAIRQNADHIVTLKGR